MIFLAELNQMEAWGTDISSAYLKAFTKEKLFIKAGPEFGDQEGHIFLLRKLSTDFELLGYGGMRGSPTVYVKWVSFLARQSPTSGCEKRQATGSTSAPTLTTWPSLAKILKPLWTSW